MKSKNSRTMREEVCMDLATGTPGQQTDEEFEALRRKVIFFLKFVGAVAAITVIAGAIGALVGPTVVAKALAVIAAVLFVWRGGSAILTLRARGTLTEGVTRASREPLYRKLDREAMEAYAQGVLDAFRRDEQP